MDAALAHEIPLRWQLQKAECKRRALQLKVPGLQQNVKGLTDELLESDTGGMIYKEVVEEHQMGNISLVNREDDKKGKPFTYEFER